MVTLGTQYVGEVFAEVWQSEVSRSWYVTFGRINVCRDTVCVGKRAAAIDYAVRYLSIPRY